MGGLLKLEAGKAGIVLFFIVISQFLFIQQANATHLRAGQIVATRLSCTSPVLRYKITITVYTDTRSTVLFGGEMDWLDFGDGSPRHLVPTQPNQIIPGLQDQFVAKAEYSIEHTFPGPGRYTISYIEPNRNRDVLNMDNSVSTTFYLETQINIDPFFGCNNTPKLLIDPIDQACVGVAFFHNPGAYDENGDSLSYEFVVPFRERNTAVTNYRDPNHPTFYNNFATGNEAGTGPPTFTINPVDGTITWDAPGGIQGEYNIAFNVVEWRKKNGQWYRIGFVRRDMQIIVGDCNNERPDLIVPEDVCVEAGTTLTATIFGIDPENHDVKIEAFSEIFNFASDKSPATYSPVPGVNDFQPSNPPAELNFEWETKCFHVKELPYQVVFKITDNPPDANGTAGKGPKLVTFKTWRIRVVAPPPVWSSATPDFTNRSALLTWQDYTCRQEAVSIQVWRRVDTITFEPDSCQTGMPPFLGYAQVGQVPATATQFNDTGLNVGARYCYRLVAVYPQPGGGESYVSQEICIPPIKAYAPVITHVSVEKTSLNDGEIRISWRSPFDVTDEGQFPKETYGYDYIVERADGFTGTNYAAIHTGTLAGDTTILDTDLDTDSKVYNYRVKAIAQNQTTPFDQSASASSVRLELRPSSGRMELNWSAVVPWSNQIQDFPLHDVFRGPENSTVESDLTLLASTNVFDRGFQYIDEGLDNNTVYCYLVKTRGGYGNNDSIPPPLVNKSQIICAKPVDDEPPCKPVLQAELTNCEDFIQQEACNFNAFSNTIFWNRPEDPVCREDIRSYNVYVANAVGGSFILFATNVTDTFYVHSNLSTFARCYRISAVDRSGNESELSDPVCNDNCPYYELPNIFTPNGDGFNDLFSAFNIREYQDCGNGEEGCQVPAHLQGRCARFVQRVELTVINRWGGEVYNYISGGENTIFIDWDGRDNGGRPLASGIYFYKADVTFDVVDPKKRVQTIKGWVHLVR